MLGVVRVRAHANGCLSFCPFLFKCLAQALDGHWSCVYFSVISQGVASLISQAMSCVVTVVESVSRRANSQFKAIKCSSEQCLPNFSFKGVTFIDCIYVCYLLPRGQWEWRPPVLQGAWR